jgi:hypothetical protein
MTTMPSSIPAHSTKKYDALSQTFDLTYGFSQGYQYCSIRNQMTLKYLALSLTAIAAALILKQPNKIRSKTFANAI